MITVAPKPAGSAAEDQRHRLTALGCRWPAVPRRLRFWLANREPGHDG